MGQEFHDGEFLMALHTKTLDTFIRVLSVPLPLEWIV